MDMNSHFIEDSKKVRQPGSESQVRPVLIRSFFSFKRGQMKNGAIAPGGGSGVDG